MGIETLVDGVRRHALPLRDDADLDPLLERIGDARVVLLGEASHGTADYYTWRDRISRRLFTEKGFRFIAVEGDWPDCYTLNLYVKGWDGQEGHARDVLHEFHRWPTWMWANRQVAHLAEWMRGFNRNLPDEKKAGFYGLDVYSLWESMDVVTRYLEKRDPALADQARRAYDCFEPYGGEGQDYAMAAALVPTDCEEEVVRTLSELRGKGPDFRRDSPEAFFNAEQNALVAQNAERYYRAMIRGGASSWNVRDHHMMETLERLMKHHGPDAKAIVWAHNTHVGDARHTDMARHGMVNLGQLAREAYGGGCVIAGFTTHRGSVIAADQWGAPMRNMTVPPALEESWEDVFHAAGGHDRLVLMDGLDEVEGAMDRRGHRAIGVVYSAARERSGGNYVPTVMPLRYDAMLYVDQTHALHPLHAETETVPQQPAEAPQGSV